MVKYSPSIHKTLVRTWRQSDKFRSSLGYVAYIARWRSASSTQDPVSKKERNLLSFHK